MHKAQPSIKHEPLNLVSVLQQEKNCQIQKKEQLTTGLSKKT